jgi:hypothetical protein
MKNKRGRRDRAATKKPQGGLGTPGLPWSVELAAAEANVILFITTRGCGCVVLAIL